MTMFAGEQKCNFTLADVIETRLKGSQIAQTYTAMAMTRCAMRRADIRHVKRTLFSLFTLQGG